MKVLIVDDSRSDRKVIRYNLEWHGCEVIDDGRGCRSSTTFYSKLSQRRVSPNKNEDWKSPSSEDGPTVTQDDRSW